MTSADSCLYFGRVVHQRFAPVRHRLSYRMFQMLLDVDAAPAVAARVKLFSYNRFNVFSFHDADHGDRTGGLLRDHVERVLAEAGLSLEGGRIHLLCMPRIFGHVFNPLSIYYCRHADGRLMAMIYEVSNTFGERHAYVIPVLERGEGPLRQACAKGFYVSPFMDMNMTYDFALSDPGETIATVIDGSDPAGRRLIFAAFTGERRDLSDAALLKALIAYPFLTLGVVAAIHWEALKLFAKGMRLRHRNPVARHAVTIVCPPSLPA